jgi:phosphate transport system substrate-binding protein
MRICLPILLALGGCGSTSVSEPTSTLATVHVVGSDTMMSSLLPALAETHQRALGTVHFDLEGGGSGEGFTALIDGRSDLSAAGRPHTPEEQERALEAGFSLEDSASKHVIGVDVLAVAAHPSNALSAMTYDEVIGVFCTGSIDDWSFLGMPEQPIRVLSRAEGSGTRALFEDFFCGPGGLGEHVQVMPLDEIRLTLESDPSALTYVSMTEPIGRVVGLKPDPRGPAVLPSQRNILRGTYPLFHDIMLYSRGVPTGNSADFLVWTASPAGQEVVDEAGFVPLFIRPDHLDSPRPGRETVHFKTDTAILTQRSLARLTMLSDELKGRSDTYDHIILEGFTDSQEPDPLRLSRQRSEAVRDALIPALPGMYMEIIPRGPVTPLAPNETAYGRERNRRVQVYLAEEEVEVPEAATEDADQAE